MRRLIPLLCALVLVLSAADCGGDARADTPPPPIKGVNKIALTVVGDTVNAVYGYKAPGLFTTDTAALTWASKAIGATAWTTVGAVVKTRGTTAAKVIPQVATGDSVRLCIVVNRVGAPPSPNVCGYKYRAPGASGGVDTIQLSVRSVIVRPDSVPVASTIPGEQVTARNQAQFCTAARLSDDTVILTATSKAIPVCGPMFANVVGLRLRDPARVTEAQLGVLFDGSDVIREQYPDGHLGPELRIVRPKVAGAFKVGGEWWLVNPLPVPTSS